MGKQYVCTSECKVCGRTLDVTYDGKAKDIGPIYCCGVKVKKIPVKQAKMSKAKAPNIIKWLAEGIDYCGQVTSKRQIYYVFEGKKIYFLLSLSRTRDNSGNFNVVKKDIVDYVQKRTLGKKGITSKSVEFLARNNKAVAKQFVALNALYVLVAKKVIVIDRKAPGQSVYFNSKK